MKETIDAFVASRKIALVGASPNKDNFGLGLMKELIKEGREVFPVNPNYEEINGTPCYYSVAALPIEVENVVILVNPDLAIEITKQCIESSIKRVWLFQGFGKGSFSNEALEILKENKIDYVYGFCPMMFMGKGFHKFHYWLKSTFSKQPPEFSMN
jgi:predicted CoA-binding protein